MCLILVPITTHSAVFGGTNFSSTRFTSLGGGYPDHDCRKPLNKPYKPYSFNSFDYEWEVERYNNAVFEYNNSVTQYVDCIEKYLDNAKNDIQRIQEKANEAVREANSSY